ANSGNNSGGRVRQYSIFNGYSSSGGNNFFSPYGQSPTESMPVRSFAVLDSGSSAVKSIQFFINADAVLRQNGGAGFGEGDLLDPSTRLGFFEGGSTGFSEQIFSIPGPGSLAAAALAGLVATRRRR
ncbi:MAG: hypothetical protein NTV94_17735, partial [Planctomycetota bacterium]|nr:hypothetical protein [Planctomycetota bacterium]